MGGFISTINDKGLCVTFFNQVYGRVTKKSLVSELGVDDHYKQYSIGDVVNCRVVKIRKHEITKHNTKRRYDYENDYNENDDDDTEDEEDSASKPRYFWQLALSLRINSADGENSDAEDGEGNEEATTEEFSPE